MPFFTSFLGDLRWVARFGLRWATSVQAKSKHLQAASSKSMCTAVWVVLGSFWARDNVWGRNLSNLNFWVPEVRKFKFGSAEKMGVDIEMSLYLRRYNYLVKEIYWWNVVYWMGVWEVAFNFWFLKIFTWFLGRAKVRVEKSFLIENLKWILGNSFSWYMDINRDIYGYIVENNV